MTTLRRTTALFLISAAAAGGCATNPVAEDFASSASKLVQIPGGESCVALLAGQTSPAGTVCSAIEGDFARFTYATTDGWTLDETHLWAGLSLSAMPQTSSGNPKLGNFPFTAGPLGGATRASFFVPLATFGLSASMAACDPTTALVVAHAAVQRARGDGSFQHETAYGAGTRLVARGNWATWFGVPMSCFEETTTAERTCQTAFARSDASATCFIGSPFLDTSRWGWTNGPFGPGSYAFPLFAGAAQCDLAKGTRVGSLGFSYDGATASVSYAMLPGFSMDATQLYIGSEPLPRDRRGDYTVAPGQYGNVHTLDAASSDGFTVSGLSGDVYVVAHVETCSTRW